VREDVVDGGVAVLAGMEPAGAAVGLERVGPAVTQGEGGSAFPQGAEAVDLGQVHAVPGRGEGGEHPTRAVDHPDLRRVPDQHHLRPGAAAAVISGSRSRVLAIDASSTITTVRSSSAVAPWPRPGPRG
jgi:hypothetical protein